jgi:hypothetical protein
VGGVAALLGVLGLTLAGCARSHPSGGGTPRPVVSAIATVTAGAGGIPVDCRSATGLGAHAASYVSTLVLSVDYREDGLLPQVVKPLVTPAFDANLGKYLASQQKTITASRLSSSVSNATARFASGSCAAPVYAVAVVRQTTTAAVGEQTQSIAVTATLTWTGSAYLLSALTSSG